MSILSQQCLVSPVQITWHHHFSLHNVALRALSEIAKTTRTYIVLGSMMGFRSCGHDEEEVCVIITNEGEPRFFPIIDEGENKSPLVKTSPKNDENKFIKLLLCPPYGTVALSFKEKPIYFRRVPHNTNCSFLLNIVISSAVEGEVNIWKTRLTRTKEWRKKTQTIIEEYEALCTPSTPVCPCIRIAPPIPFGSATTVVIGSETVVTSPHYEEYAFRVPLKIRHNQNNVEDIVDESSPEKLKNHQDSRLKVVTLGTPASDSNIALLNNARTGGQKEASIISSNISYGKVFLSTWKDSEKGRIKKPLRLLNQPSSEIKQTSTDQAVTALSAVITCTSKWCTVFSTATCNVLWAYVCLPNEALVSCVTRKAMSNNDTPRAVPTLILSTIESEKNRFKLLFFEYENLIIGLYAPFSIFIDLETDRNPSPKFSLQRCTNPESYCERTYERTLTTSENEDSNVGMGYNKLTESRLSILSVLCSDSTETGGFHANYVIFDQTTNKLLFSTLMLSEGNNSAVLVTREKVKIDEDKNQKVEFISVESTLLRGSYSKEVQGYSYIATKGGSLVIATWLIIDPYIKVRAGNIAILQNNTLPHSSGPNYSVHVSLYAPKDWEKRSRPSFLTDQMKESCLIRLAMYIGKEKNSQNTMGEQQYKVDSYFMCYYANLEIRVWFFSDEGMFAKLWLSNSYKLVDQIYELIPIMQESTDFNYNVERSSTCKTETDQNISPIFHDKQNNQRAKNIVQERVKLLYKRVLAEYSNTNETTMRNTTGFPQNFLQMGSRHIRIHSTTISQSHEGTLISEIVRDQIDDGDQFVHVAGSSDGSILAAFLTSGRLRLFLREKKNQVAVEQSSGARSGV